LLGVAATVGERLNIDPFCVRIALIVLAFSAMPVFAAGYLIAGIALRHNASEGSRSPIVGTRAPSAITLGWVAVAVGGFFFVSALSHWIDMKLLVGMALIVVGVNVVLRYRERD
jgi:phage shock protein PspC (stress-responsive transcriptional regulator)